MLNLGPENQESSLNSDIAGLLQERDRLDGYHRVLVNACSSWSTTNSLLRVTAFVFR